VAINVPAPSARSQPVPAEPARRPGEGGGVPRLYSDKELMDNPEGDRRILRRAHQLADERNRRSGAA